MLIVHACIMIITNACSLIVVHACDMIIIHACIIIVIFYYVLHGSWAAKLMAGSLGSEAYQGSRKVWGVKGPQLWTKTMVACIRTPHLPPSPSHYSCFKIYFLFCNIFQNWKTISPLPPLLFLAIRGRKNKNNYDHYAHASLLEFWYSMPSHSTNAFTASRSPCFPNDAVGLPNLRQVSSNPCARGSPVWT